MGYLSHALWVLRNGSISDPDAYLPLDTFQGSTVLGTLNGTVVGNVAQIAGKHEQGIELEPAAYVEFDVQNQGCIGDISSCTNGFTYSLWLFVLSGEFDTVEDRHIIYSGREGDDAMLEIRHKDGFAYTYLSADVYHANRRVNNLPDFRVDRWAHVVFSWLAGGDVNVYINGCKDNNYMTVESSVVAPTGGNRFYIGRQIQTDVNDFHIKVDELHVWYEVLTDQEVWQLYIQGGIVSQT